MKYRKEYEYMTGECIPKTYHVHHLDHDRGNNNILNLVAIPNKLHTKYHALHCKFKNSIDIINNQYGFINIGQQLECIDNIVKFMKIKDQLLDYINRRNWLIHNNS